MKTQRSQPSLCISHPRTLLVWVPLLAVGQLWLEQSLQELGGDGEQLGCGFPVAPVGPSGEGVPVAGFAPVGGWVLRLCSEARPSPPSAPGGSGGPQEQGGKSQTLGKLASFRADGGRWDSGPSTAPLHQGPGHVSPSFDFQRLALGLIFAAGRAAPAVKSLKLWPFASFLLPHPSFFPSFLSLPAQTGINPATQPALGRASWPRRKWTQTPALPGARRERPPPKIRLTVTPLSR